MTNYFTRWVTVCMAVFLMLGTLVPFAPVHAQTVSTQVPVGVYAFHEDDEDHDDEDEDEEEARNNNDDDEEDDDIGRYFRGRYSSSIQRKINKLDDDEVDKMPIPIVMGIQLNDLWPNFGDPRDGGARKHEGLDIMAPRGAIIASPTEAVVTRTGKGSSSGIYVQTANPGGEIFNYYHLDSIEDGIKAGVELEEGDVIGYVGNTGNASGGAPHLHFEIREGRRAEDPLPRLTHEFSSEVRIAVLTEILKELQAQLKRLLD